MFGRKHRKFKMEVFKWKKSFFSNTLQFFKTCFYETAQVWISKTIPCQNFQLSCLRYQRKIWMNEQRTFKFVYFCTTRGSFEKWIGKLHWNTNLNVRHIQSYNFHFVTHVKYSSYYLLSSIINIFIWSLFVRLRRLETYGCACVTRHELWIYL